MAAVAGSVAGHHHGANAQFTQFGDQRRRVRARRVAERDQSRERHRVRRPGRDRQHPEALFLEFLARGRRGRRGLGETDDRRERAFHDALRRPVGILDRRLGHFRRRIERHELDQLRRVGNRLARGGGANGAVHRILAAVRTGQGGQRQHVRLVETGHRTNFVTLSSFWVRVPVLSAHRTVIVAASSTAERRVGRTPSFASACAPSADASVKVAGSATGIEARTAVRTRGMISASGILSKVGVSHEQRR